MAFGPVFKVKFKSINMSDLGRKNISDKISEGVTPDSNKSTLEKTKETVTDKVDQFAGSSVPDSQKSFSQTVADGVGKGHGDAKDAVKQDQETLSETASKYVDAAKEQVSNAAEYVSGVISGATEGAKAGGEKK